MYRFTSDDTQLAFAYVSIQYANEENLILCLIPGLVCRALPLSRSQHSCAISIVKTHYSRAQTTVKSMFSSQLGDH